MAKGLEGLFQQARELQERLAGAQQALADRVVAGSAGGGMVTVEVTGKLELRAVRIDPTLLDAPDRDMLQDLVVAAVNDGIRRAQTMVAEEMSKLTGGIKLPGLG